MNLLKALFTISGMTLISRILGFVRDFVIAKGFGDGMLTDAFVIAFRLPNLLRRLFAEGAFSQAFVPILAEYKNKEGEEKTKALVDHVFSLLVIILLVVTLLGVIGAPLLIYVSAPGFASNADKFEVTVQLTRITFPYILFMSLAALSGAILNTWNRFAIPAFAPVLLNVAFIVMALFAAPYFEKPIMALGWAVFIGGVLQLALFLPFLKKIGMLPRFSLNLHHPGVKRILSLMLPAVFGVSVAQISLLLNTIFASFLNNGSVSWLYFADRLMEFPSGLLGAALGTILLPSLSKYHANGRQEEYSKLLDWGLRLTMLLAAPAAVALAILGIPLISTLFYHGEFTAEGVFRTRDALFCYSTGLLALILIKVMAPGFYAQQNIKTPVRIGITALIATQLMNLFFVFALDLRHAGLALSISMAAWLNAGLLFYGLRKRAIYQPLPGWVPFYAKLFLALLVMGGMIHWSMGEAALWLAWSSGARIWRLSLIVFFSSFTYFATLWLCGFRLRDFTRRAAE